MAVSQVLWSGGRGEDLHVVNGADSVDLRTLLRIDGVAPTSPIAGVTVSFDAKFDHSPVGLDLVGGFGVIVNTRSGQVRVTSAAPRIRSFLIEAKVAHAGSPHSVFIRVNVHASIERIWLTPGDLHLRQVAHGQKLTLLAEFSGGRTGVVNNIPNLAWSSSDMAKVVVGADGALSILASASTATITATLPAAYQVGAVAANPSTSATIHCQPSWLHNRPAKLLAGSAGFALRNEVRNIVLLSDGFVAGEEALFDRAALAFADFMRTSYASLPYKLCRDRINFWSVWVESPQRGTSILTPVVPDTPGRGTRIADATPASAPAVPASLAQLVERVGLPTTADRNRAGTLSIADLVSGILFQFPEWSTLYGLGFTAALNADIYKQWVLLAGARQLDERDTAFGLASGGWPNVEDPTVLRSVDLSPSRTNRAHLDQLLPMLTDAATGASLGNLWGPGQPSRPHVLLVGFGGPWGGIRNGGDEIIAVSVEDDTGVPLNAIGPGMRTTLVPFPFPRTISLSSLTTFVHETAHSFGLKDRYGGSPTFPVAMNADVQGSLNVQPADTALQVPPPGIDPALLKWNLPRIERAARVVQAPAIVGAEVHVVVARGHATRFAAPDVVRFRQRLLAPTSKVSGALEVLAPPAAVPNGELLRLAPRAGTVIAPADFPPGSILFVQKFVGTALTLIADDIAAHITTTGVALNTGFGTAAAAYVCVPDTSKWGRHWTIQRARNIPADPARSGKALKPYRPTQTAWIVGAYEGGRGYDCGVLHPTGACIMRQLAVPDVRVRGRVTGLAYQFCAVCAYVLVDALDPSQHAELERVLIEPRNYRPTK